MDWHPVISVHHTTDTWQWLLSFQHFKCTFCILGIFSKTGKTRVSHRVKMMTRWPGRENDPNDPLTRWPNDPVPCLVCVRVFVSASFSVSLLNGKSIAFYAFTNLYERSSWRFGILLIYRKYHGMTEIRLSFQRLPRMAEITVADLERLGLVY